MKTYVLIGNFGVGNLGDEALREYFLTRFPEVHWKTISAHPNSEEYSRLPAGFRSLCSLSWIRTIRLIRKSDGIVFGGGTLFTDTESVKAPFLWWIHASAARLLGRPRFFAFQGIGPFRTKAGEWFTRSALRGAAHISVRDALSYERVLSLSKNNKCIQSFDPVFSLIKNKKAHDRSKKILGVIPRKNSGATLRKSVVEHMNISSFDSVVILSLQPHDPDELRYCLTLAKEIGATVEPVRTVSELAAGVGACSEILTERYHGAIAALALHVPYVSVAQTKGDKLAAVAAHMSSECSALVSTGELALRDALLL